MQAPSYSRVLTNSPQPVFWDLITNGGLKPTQAVCGVAGGQVEGWGRSAAGRRSDGRACYSHSGLFPCF